VAILDIGLPDGDGCALLNTTAIPRGVTISGYGTALDHERSQAAGFAVHLVKPVSLQQILRAINDVMS
jgi:CheY-like chemotaxis protein